MGHLVWGRLAMSSTLCPLCLESGRSPIRQCRGQGFAKHPHVVQESKKRLKASPENWDIIHQTPAHSPDFSAPSSFPPKQVLPDQKGKRLLACCFSKVSLVCSHLPAVFVYRAE